jgi:ATP-dependent Lon protease
MQGDVMKESMSVAKTLAWKLTPIETQQGLIKELDDTKNQGLHIHCPDGSVSKDGPSAGTAITCVIYSLLNNKKIKHNIAITGEITLQGNVTAIGGLDLKIIGGIRAGVKTFIYPMSNHREFEECELKYKKLFDKNGIKFIEVDKILDVFPHIFE